MSFFFMLILSAIFFVLGEILRPKPNFENAKPAGIDDFNFPTATEGRAVPLVWGTVKLSGPNVVWYGDLLQVAISEKVKTGMFSSEEVVRGYRYHVGIQMALCLGPLDSLRGIEIGEDSVFSGNQAVNGTISLSDLELHGGDDFGNGGIAGDLDVYLGTTTQTANTYLSNFQQQGGDTPAYRNIAYVVFKQGYIGNSPSIKPWAFEVRRNPDPMGLGGATNELNSNNDTNCASVIYEIMTNTIWGLGIPSSEIDIGNFTAVAAQLASENNGFSFVATSLMSARELIQLIEQQIDGFVFTDRSTGKWKINLVREGDASVGTIDETNTIELKDFGRNTWEDTSNHVRIQYFDRSKNYNPTYALAQDSANFRAIGRVITADQKYPGVKDADLANELAWRDLRTLSRPVAKATVIVDRTFYLVNPGDLVKFTSPQLGITELEMRVIKVDLGNLIQGRIELTLAEDVFTTHAASFAPAQPTGWSSPSHTMTDIPTADKVVFEAPRAFVSRDPKNLGVAQRIWAGARNHTGTATWFDILGDGVDEGTSVRFLYAGKLNAAVTRNSTSTIVLKSDDPDTQTNLADAMSAASNEDRGAQLANLVYINGEFISVADAQASASVVNLTSPVRGFCDTTPQEHAVDDLCYILHAGGAMTDGIFDQASVDIKLIPRSILDTLASGSATPQTITINDRYILPYPPLRPTLNGSGVYPTSSVSLDATATGAGDDDIGFVVGFTRRDFRTTDEYKAQLNEDTLPSDFPSAHSTVYRVKVINDPDGSPTTLYTTDYNSGGNTVPVSRTEILANNSGSIPSRLRIEVETQHTVNGTDYSALNVLQWDFDVDSAEFDAGDTELGVLAQNVISAVYTVVSNASHTLSIGSDVITGGNAVQARINGGSFTNIITSGSTSGSLGSLSISDTVEIRHTQAASSVNTIVKINDSASGDTAEAFGVLQV